MSGVGFHRLRFGPFELSIDQTELRRDGVVLPLGSRALDILIYYIAQLTEISAAYSLLPHRAAASGLRGQWLVLQNNPGEAEPHAGSIWTHQRGSQSGVGCERLAGSRARSANPRLA
jgi:hypothetical protein